MPFYKFQVFDVRGALPARHRGPPQLDAARREEMRRSGARMTLDVHVISPEDNQMLGHDGREEDAPPLLRLCLDDWPFSARAERRSLMSLQIGRLPDPSMRCAKARDRQQAHPASD